MMNARDPRGGNGVTAVHRMVEAGHRQELAQVQAVLDCCKVIGSTELCGRWVNHHLAPEVRETLGRRNLRTLARFGIVVPTGETARTGHRAYYMVPDAAGTSAALREYGFPG